MQKIKSVLNRTVSILKTVAGLMRKNSLPLLFTKGLGLLAREGLTGLTRVINENRYYDLWLKKQTLGPEEREAIRQNIEKFTYKPLISVVVPVYNIEEQFLRECIESVQEQFYPNWELCIADDASPGAAVKLVLEEKAAEDKRIKVVYREKNGHISAASNSALALAAGEFIALLDHDDRLAADALYENVKLLNCNPDADMIYSDEDKINEAGERQMPFFKPDWSPDTFMSQMYTCHLGLYRTALVREIKGFREGFEGSQDYDLVLRLTEKTNRIYHIPKVLYHWRAAQSSSAMNVTAKEYAYEAGLKALQEATVRRGEAAVVEKLEGKPGHYRVKYLLKSSPRVTMIIAAVTSPAALAKTLLAVYKISAYQNYEITIINSGEPIKLNNIDLPSAVAALKEKITVLPAEGSLDYSLLYNKAAATAESPLLLFLKDNTEVITGNWLTEMSAQALRPSVGAVGAKLFYPDNTIEHAGITIGLGGLAGHRQRFFKGDSGEYYNRLSVNSNYAAVSGTCMMVEKKLFDEVSGFDPQMGNDLFDIDFCLQLVEKGYYNLVLADVHLYYDQLKNKEIGGKGSPVFCKRWAKYIKRDPFYNPNLSLQRGDYSISIE